MAALDYMVKHIVSFKESLKLPPCGSHLKAPTFPLVVHRVDISEVRDILIQKWKRGPITGLGA